MVRLIQHGALVPFALVTSLFFLRGMPNNLNDVLIRQFLKSFEIQVAYLVPIAGYLAEMAYVFWVAM